MSTPTMSSAVSPILTVSPCVSIANLTADGLLATPVVDDVLDTTIGRIFETQSAAIERWLREKATPEMVKKLHGITEELKTTNVGVGVGATTGGSSSVYTPCYAKRPSVTSELFNQWLSTGSPKVHITI